MMNSGMTAIFRLIFFGGILLTTISYAGLCKDPSAGPSTGLVVSDLKADLRSDPIGLTDIPRLGWEISSPTRNTMQQSYSIRCAGNLEDLIRGKNLTWDPGEVESDRSQYVAYEGPVPAAGEKTWWHVRIRDNQGRLSSWSEPAFFQMGFRDASAWKARWIEPDIREDPGLSTPCPHLRKEFDIPEKVKQATVYVTARGLYELHLNGRRVGEDHFTPGWTTYHHRLCYQVYDVTDYLSSGPNAMGAILGDGWYRGYMGWSDEKNFYGEKTALLLQMEITYESGSKETICTDNSWRSATGPILSSDILNGETYDARLELEGWDRPGAEDGHWSGVRVGETPGNNLEGMCGVPVRVIRTLKPVKKFRTPEGDLVFDMGQNMVGRVRFRLKGERGSRIVIHHAEVLDRDGNFYTSNLRGAKAEDIYIFRGEGVETYEPRFTFHGFRYIRIREYEGEISEKDFEGVVLSSRVGTAGSFTCSDSLVNRLQENIVWGLYGNFLDVPTDCPQRDERMGWTGDAQVFAPTACFNVDAYHFYRKWLVDLALDQRSDGSVPWVVPNVLPDGGGTGWSDGYGATGWADAAVIIPWVLYRVYGDVGVLEDQYGSMKAWVEYMVRESGDNLVFSSGFHFGDWLSFAEYYSYYYNAPDYGYAGAHTSKELIATAYYYHSTGILKQVAKILGYEEDYERYNDLETRIKEAFEREFITGSGRLVSETQTAYALALVFGILPEEFQGTIARRLADDVNHFGHLTTGFLGTPVLCQALSDNGYQEVAMKLLLNRRYPSWLYPVSMGATTIWERWDGIRPDGSFQTPGMNSFNHYAYGAVGNWLYSSLAGIRPDTEQPGYRLVHIEPVFAGEMEYAEARYSSVYGEITSRWQRREEAIELKVVVPPNCRSRITLPLDDPSELLEGNRPVSGNRDLSVTGSSDGILSISTGSGEYLFRFPEKTIGRNSQALPIQ